MFGSITNWIQHLCSQKDYCPVYSELEEATLATIFAAVFVCGFAREIYIRKLDGRNSELYTLRDDMFDIILLRIFGIIMLSLAAATWQWQYETVQVDVLIFQVVLAATSLAVNNNKMGLLMVALSYCSWYGWFRLLMVTPFGTDFHLLLQPQWISALLAYTAPTLISNLKYPALLNTDLARVAFGLIPFGIILATYASLVWVDAWIISNDLVPNYTAGLMDGTRFRIYGPNVTPLARIGHLACMSVLQFITCLVPHFMLNEEALREQLLEQQGKKNDPTTSTSNTHFKFATESRANPTGTATEHASSGGEADVTDLPEDSVEITAEQAIEMQERFVKSREAEATRSASGLSQRKMASNTH